MSYLEAPVSDKSPVAGLAGEVAVRADELLGAVVLQLDVAVDVELVVVAVVALRALDLARLALQQLPPLVRLHVRLRGREDRTFKFLTRKCGLTH